MITFITLIILPTILTLVPETCKVPPLKDTSFCDINLPISSRITDLLKRLTIDEKISQLINTAPGIERLNINPYQWWQEALHGLAFSPGANFSGKASVVTSFPQVINLGQCFDTDLYLKIGTAISDEARALANLGQGFLSFWTPNINGSKGEDPYLTSEYVKNFIDGMQNGIDPKFLKTNPCCKHYTAYDLENWKGVDRYHFDAKIETQDMVESYQPPFRACVEIGKVKQIIIPNCASELFLNDVLRNDWEFDGHVVSDCGAINAVYSCHKYTKTPEESAAKSLKAGCDLDCGDFYKKHLGEAYKKKMINEDDLDLALFRLFKNRILEGEFNPFEDQIYRKIPYTVINSKEHQELALKAARESIVLLKNEKNILPLNKDQYKKIAVIGPHSKATQAMQGNYIGPPPYLISPFEGLSKYSSNLQYSKGCDVNSTDKSHFDEAKNLAESSDAVILVMGIDGHIENEMNDRNEIDFPGVQEDLIKLIKSSSKGPVICKNIFKIKNLKVVIMNGGSIDISYAKDNFPALLAAGYPGQSGGQALAEIIFGDINPSGRLTQTIYPKDYVNQISFFDMKFRNHTNSPGRGYRWYQGKAIYEFGHGLSYTTFKYEWSNENVMEIRKSNLQDQHFTVKVTNIGNKDGDDVVLAYITNTFNDDSPKKQLFAFKRVHLKSGHSTVLYFGFKKSDFFYVNKKGNQEIQNGLYVITLEGLSGKLKKKVLLTE